MENKQSINTVFGLMVIIFLTSILLLGNAKDDNKNIDSEDDNRITLSYLLQRRNEKVRKLSNQLEEKQTELGTLKQEIASIKSDLDSANQKLSKMMTTVRDAQ